MEEIILGDSMRVFLHNNDVIEGFVSGVSYEGNFAYLAIIDRKKKYKGVNTMFSLSVNIDLRKEKIYYLYARRVMTEKLIFKKFTNRIHTISYS